MSFRSSRLVVYGLAAGLAAVPSFASAQMDVIRSGLHDSATKAGFATNACDGATCLTNIIGLVINTLLSFAGVLLLGLLLWAGFKWMTSDGDKGATEARAMIKNAVIGLVVLVSSYAIASFVLDKLSGIAGSGTPNPPAGATGGTHTYTSCTDMTELASCSSFCPGHPTEGACPAYCASAGCSGSGASGGTSGTCLCYCAYHTVTGTACPGPSGLALPAGTTIPTGFCYDGRATPVSDSAACATECGTHLSAETPPVAGQMLTCSSATAHL